MGAFFLLIFIFSENFKDISPNNDEMICQKLLELPLKSSWVLAGTGRVRKIYLEK
jgi:hypothetical protein